jgi:hypothetical protein
MVKIESLEARVPMNVLTEEELRAFGDRLERWFNALSGGEQLLLRDILARAAAATRLLENAVADYATFDPSDLVFRCGLTYLDRGVEGEWRERRGVDRW